MTLVGGALAFDLIVARAQRHWSPANRTAYNLQESASHVAGIRSWIPLLASRRASDANYAKCVSQLVGVRGDNINPTGIILIGSISNGIQGSKPTKECSTFTTLPVEKIGK